MKFTPIVAHNLSNYDLHLLCLALHASSKNNLIKIIPQTDVKYVSLSLKLFVGVYKREDGKEVSIYEEMRFIDSYRFMNMSLVKLVSFLPVEASAILDDLFSASHTTEEIKLLHRKGFCPYSYADRFEKFNETKLPPPP